MGGYDPNWLYFGYNLSYLRDVSAGGGYAQYVPNATIYYSQDWENQLPPEQRQPYTPPDETPAPDSDEAAGTTIDQVNRQIMGEQPGTTFERATQWANLSTMLFNVQNELFNQTSDLEAKWESPEAKRSFLHEVGKTLAYTQVWRDAADDNATALNSLGAEMYSAQNKMRTLWAEYQKELREAAETSLKMGPMKGLKGEAKEVMISFTASSDNDPYVKLAKEEYNEKARQLASETANAYAPIVQKLQAGRANMMTPLNAVEHPGAYGGPLPPGLTTPGGGPGAPGAPSAFGTGAPGRPAPTAPPPGFRGNAPTTPGGGGTPTGAPTPLTTPAPRAPMAPNATPNAPVPQAPAAPGTTPPGPPGIAPPIAPGLAPPIAPGSRVTPGAFGPNRFGGAAPLAPGGGSSMTPGGSGLPGNAPATTPGTSPPATSLPGAGGSHPPGTIAPPPGGSAPQQPKKNQGKVLGAPGAPGGPGVPGLPGLGSTAGSAPPVPPGGAAPSRRNNTPGTPMPGMPQQLETPEAFRIPPAGSAPVLDNTKQARKRAKKKAAADAALAASAPATPGAIPPVLANRRLAQNAGKPTTSKKAKKIGHRKTGTPSEFAVGLPTGTAPVFEGRTNTDHRAPGSAAGDVPIALRGPSPANAAQHDRHAMPAVQADRTTRSLHQPDTPAPSQPSHTQHDSWDIQTPGGPVVAGGQQQEQYRPEPEPTLGTKR